MTKMPSPNLFPKLVLSSEILAVAEALVQSSFRLGSALLGDRALLRLGCVAEPLRQRRLDVLRRRRRRERPPEEPSRSRWTPRRRRRHAAGERARGHSVRIRAWPRARVRGPSRRILHREHVDGAVTPASRRQRRLRPIVRDRSNCGYGRVILGCWIGLAVALPHPESLLRHWIRSRRSQSLHIGRIWLSPEREREICGEKTIKEGNEGEFESEREAETGTEERKVCLETKTSVTEGERGEKSWGAINCALLKKRGNSPIVRFAVIRNGK